MPWSLHNRDGKWCVVKEGESEPVPGGCHSSRADAIKHQRALYANESRVASQYAELDALPEPAPVVMNAGASPFTHLSPFATELVGLLLKDDRERSLVASVAETQQAALSQMKEDTEERRALVAALERMAQPNIHVPAPEVNVRVDAPQITVDVPTPEVIVAAPTVEVQVAAPEVTVRPQITVPQTPARKVTFERDLLTGRVVGAEVSEI